MTEGGGRLALVTGGSGFVGSHVVDALLGAGWRVRCLVRAHSRLDRLPVDRVERVRGAVTEPASLDAALAGVTLVVHAAGLVRARDEAAYRRVNAEGTAALARAARRAAPGLDRFVLVSSVAAGGPSFPGHPRPEEDDDAPVSPYGRSKLAGEDALRAAGDVPWTIVRPPAVYGPRDDAFPRLYRMVARGFVFRISGPTQPVSIVHARDLAEGILLAATAPAARGRTYYLAHPVVTTWREIAGWAGAAMGRGAREVALPRGLVPAVSRASGILNALLGRENPLPADRLSDLLAPAWTCSPARAERELGFRAVRDHAAGIAEAVVAWRTRGTAR